MSAASAWAVYRLPLEKPPAAPRVEALARDKTEKRLALADLVWFCQLRWLVVGGLALLGAAGPCYTRAFPHGGLILEPGWPLAVAGLLTALNVGYLLAARRIPVGQPETDARVIGNLWLQSLVDLAVLTVVVHYLGSLESGAAFMYLFHIVLACIVLRVRQSLLVLLWAMGMYLACLALEQSGLLPPHSILRAPADASRTALPAGVLAWQCATVLFISSTVWYLASRLARALRRRERELAATNQRLVAATEERAQHMLRTTHQLKAPFAAVQANTQVLLGGYCGALPDAAVSVLKHISARCDMLAKEIKEMLQLANLRSTAQEAPAVATLDLAVTVQTCLSALRPIAQQRQITFLEEVQPALTRAVPDHLTMLVDNILANAVNYSRDGGEVRVSCRGLPSGQARLVVADRGIGIPADKLPRIFEDFFRTNEAVRHNKSSTGLGLAIVRQVAVAGNIAVQVESAAEEGTVFTLDFPSPDAPLPNQ